MDIKEKFDIHGRCAIVTGGAGDLGFVMVEALAQAGANVVITDVDQKKIDKAVESLSKYDVEVVGVLADITNEEDVMQLRDKTVDQFGEIDILVNCAGIFKMANLEDHSVEDFNKIMQVNVTGTFLMTREIGKQMIKQKKGSIINIASHSGTIVNTPQCHAGYNTSKAAVMHFTKCIAAEWAQHGIRANSISPGYMKEGMAVPFFEKGGEMVDRWMTFSPMNRPGTADELVGALLYLASDASSFTSGIDMMINGAYHVW